MNTFNLGGDCAITVGDNADTQIQIYASSAVLSKASPQFASLWQTSEIVTDLYFPEDNPVAFTLLMMILHHRYDSTTPPEPAQLLEFAVIASNYGCVNRVRGAAGLFPPETMMRYITKDNEAVRDLAVSAYLLDDPLLFEKYTRLLLLTTDSTLALATSAVGKMLPATAWLSLESRRSTLMKGFLRAQSFLLRKPCPFTDLRCARTTVFHHTLLKAVSDVGLDRLGGDTLQAMFQEIENLEYPKLGTQAHCGECYGHRYPHDGDRWENVKKVLEENCEGLCLDCVLKERVEGGSDGVCRIEHL